MRSNQGVQAQFRSSVQNASARIGARMNNGTQILSVSNLISALIGLAIGLFLAWQVWPVEWVGARPSDLDADAKAQYLAAVAEAYVVGGEDANAQMLAQRRLQGMDLATEIPNAVAYFQQGALGNGGAESVGSAPASDAYQQSFQSDGNIRISHLLRMAAGLGVNAQLPPAAAVESADTASGETGVGEANVADVNSAALDPNADAAASASTETDPSAQLNMSDNFRLLLSGLTSLLLVLGGLYILLRLARANNWLPFATQGAAAASGGGQSVQPVESMSERELISEYSQDPLQVEPFEDEFAAAEPRQYRVRPDSAETRGATGYAPRESAAPYHPAGYDRYEERAPDDGFDDDEPLEGEVYEENYRYADELTEDDEALRDEYERPAYHRSAAGNLPPSIVGRADELDDDEAVRASAANIIEQYITHYEQGAVDYEERRNIQVEESDAPSASLGEYGIGVNYKNGILGADASQVIAMDVWLYDKTDDKNAVYKTQVLLSERASQLDEVREVLESDQVDHPPLLPREGMTFQLEGRSLLLECEVQVVEFSEDDEAPGVFDALEVEFTLRRK